MTDQFLHDQTILIDALAGLAPVHRSSNDKWGWGSTGVYTVAHGMSAIHSPHASLLSTALWKSIWSPFGLPKVIFFSWLLMHQKVLTGENLLRRGFLGPFRCCLCKAESESSDHLFVECVFIHSVWKLTLKDLQIAPPSGMSATALYSSWKDRVSSSILNHVG